MTSSWLVLALAFALVTAAAGVLYLGARGGPGREDGTAPPSRDGRSKPPEDDARG